MGFRALVVDDEAALADVVASYLRREHFEVTVCHSGAEALAVARQVDPDVVVLDLGLPGIDGLEVCRQMRTFSDAYVVMLTARDTELDTIVGLSVGADDYITKPFSPKELVARINTVLRRTAPQHAMQEIQFADCVLRDDDLSLVQGERVIQIGGTEYKLLKFFLTHSERSYTRAQLLDLVWGDHVYIEERTVDVHILRLRKILQKVGLEAHLETVRGVGYRWQNEVQK